MGITAFSFITAVLCCNFYIVLIAILGKRKNFIRYYSPLPLLFLFALCVGRLFCFFELPFAVVLQSFTVFPAVRIPLVTPRSFLGGQSIFLLLLIIWGAGTVFLLIKGVLNTIRYNRFLEAGVKADTFSSELSACIKRLGMSCRKKPVKIYVSQNAALPVAGGYLAPVIYLPDLAFTEEELFSILLHEYTHIQQKDIWLKTLMFGLSAVFWWNPFIYLLKANLDYILEVRCDLNGTKNLSEEETCVYLSSITKVVKHCVRTKDDISLRHVFNVSGLISTKKEKKIVERFQLVLEGQAHRKGVPVLIALYAVFIGMFAFSNLFVIQPAGHPPQEPGTFSITPENAYIVVNEDSSYSLYADGIYRGELERIDRPPFEELPIKE